MKKEYLIKNLSLQLSCNFLHRHESVSTFWTLSLSRFLITVATSRHWSHLHFHNTLQWASRYLATEARQCSTYLNDRASCQPNEIHLLAASQSLRYPSRVTTHPTPKDCPWAAMTVCTRLTCATRHFFLPEASSVYADDTAPTVGDLLSKLF